VPIEICYRFPNIEEGGIVPVGKEVEFGHEHIDPADAKFIFDYSSREDEPCELTIITCNEADDGAQLFYMYPEEPFNKRDDYEGLTEDDLPDGVEKDEMDDDVLYEQELTLEDGTDVIFMARYTPPDEISEGFVIPTSLIHRN
jgi:hypothetical protein